MTLKAFLLAERFENRAQNAALYNFIQRRRLALPDFPGRCKCPVSKWLMINVKTRKKAGIFWRNIKTLLDGVFVISGIIKVEASVISRAEG